MKKHALSWLADRLIPKPATLAEPIGYKAIAEALETADAAKLRADLVALGAPVNPQPLTTSVTEVDGPVVAGASAGEVLGPSSVLVAPTVGSPEHNLMLIEKLIVSLNNRINTANTKRADQRKAYDEDMRERVIKQEQSDQAQAAEIAGLSKSLAAYTAARDVLNPPTPGEPDTKPRVAREERLKNGSFVDIEGKEHEIVSRTRAGARRVTLDGRVHHVLPRNVQPPTE